MRRVLLVLIAACGVRAPAPADVGAMLARRGPIEAHRDLEIRIVADPKDIGARLALAELDERIGRTGEALGELVTVEHLGGPLGTRWHDADRERLARLLVARARVRLAREAATAEDDLEHAHRLGAAIDERDRIAARVAIAVTRLRHVDADERAHGRAILAELAARPDAEPGWTGARKNAAPAERAAFGVWAWAIGARREGYEQLAAWHDATTRPRDPALEAAYLRALAWWSPPEREPPDETIDAVRCYFASAGCAPRVEPRAPLPLAMPAGAEPRAWAAARYALARAAAPPDDLYAIARAFYRDPDVADRLARDLVAASIDEAAGDAAVGALFDALGDPARARASWQAAVDESAEPRFLRGLAEATARAGDGPAAHVFATAAAAAWGDPAVVWLAVARDLAAAGQTVDALAAARSAIELGDVETLPGAFDVAIAASRQLGRDDQAAGFTAVRARLAPASPELAEALAALGALPTQGSLDRAWEVSRAHPRDVDVRAALYAALPATDPRRAELAKELIESAGDPDPTRGLAAVRALREK